jgi:hypothetical protein
MNDTERLIKTFESAVLKDQTEIEIQKKRFIEEIKSGLGKQMNDYTTYIKPEPTFKTKILNKLKKILRYI